MTQGDQAGCRRTLGEQLDGVPGRGDHGCLPAQQTGLRDQELGELASSRDDQMGYGREGLDEDEPVLREASVAARPAAGEEIPGTSTAWAGPSSAVSSHFFGVETVLTASVWPSSSRVISAASVPSPSTVHQRAGTTSSGCSRISACPPQVRPA
jgi:hypothetical protein